MVFFKAIIGSYRNRSVWDEKKPYPPWGSFVMSVGTLR